MSKHLDRIKAMPSDESGAWDFDSDDLDAIRWAIKTHEQMLHALKESTAAIPERSPVRPIVLAAIAAAEKGVEG